MLNYGGAALPKTVWDRWREMIATAGREIIFGSGWGATETAPQATLVYFEPLRSSVIGLPIPGCSLKMVPVEGTGKYELRVAGPNVTPGYWKQPELTKAAFDEEGFYRIGDAGVFADSTDPSKGIEFAGRLAEDFKLSSGAWVHTGELRIRSISALSPVAQDVVITGHDRDEVGLLIFPAAHGLSLQDARERVQHGLEELRKAGGLATSPTRAILLERPPSIDEGEITDKGYINQRTVLSNRSNVVERLYADPPPPEVIR